MFRSSQRRTGASRSAAIDAEAGTESTSSMEKTGVPVIGAPLSVASRC